MPESKRLPVNSSWVSTISYSGGMLTVTTKHGRIFSYLSVPEYLWQQLQASPSKGEFLNAKIKGKFAER